MSARRTGRGGTHPIYDLHGSRGDEQVKPEDIPEKLRELDAAWKRGAELAARGERVPRPDWCGGACLEVTPSRATDLRARYGIEFEVPPPKEDKNTTNQLFIVRVKCRQHSLPMGVVCRDCKTLEDGNWMWVKARLANAAADARRASKSKREGLDE